MYDMLPGAQEVDLPPDDTLYEQHPTRTDGCGIRLGNVHSRGTARHMHRLNDTSGVPNKQLRRGQKNPVGKRKPPPVITSH